MFRIRFHGRGGQGIKTASCVLGTAFFLEGYTVQDAPRYGAERRSAPIFAYVRAVRGAIDERQRVPADPRRELPGGARLGAARLSHRRARRRAAARTGQPRRLSPLLHPRAPVEDYLHLQGRFAHLFEPRRDEETLRRIQSRVDAYWAEVP